MFKHIYFLRYRDTVDFHNIQETDDYRKFIEEYDFDHDTKQDYYLDGEICYLMQHPLLPERQKNLMYLQSFDYMRSGPSYYTSREKFQSFLILYTYEGSGSLRYNNGLYNLQKGDGFIIDCRHEHFYRTEGTCWLHGDLHFCGGQSAFFYQENFHGKSPLFHIPDQDVFQNQLEKLLRIQNSATVHRDFQFSFELERLLFYLMERQDTGASGNMIPEYIRLLQNYLEKHFTSDMTLDEMAHMTGTSKYHLCRQFKNYTGFAPKKYITHLRLLYARNLLQQTKMPGYRIGILAGFPSEAAFILQFKKATGMAPGEFRKRSGGAAAKQE